MKPPAPFPLPERPLTVGEAFAAAVAAFKADQHDQARDLLTRIARVQPTEVDVYNLLGAVEYKARDLPRAIMNFRKVLKLKPDHDEARLNLAQTYRDSGQWTEAAAEFQRLAEGGTGNTPGLLVDWARAEANLGHFFEAAKVYQRALEIHANKDPVQIELGNVLLKLNRAAEAEAQYREILARAPGYLPALINLGIVLDVRGAMDEALQWLETAARTDPTSVDAHFHLALALLARARLTEGWSEYAWRFRRASTTTLHDRFNLPYWDGQPLGGRHLLVWTEQGPGDEILAASMLPDVLDAGAQVTLVCSERLAPLFRRSFPDVAVVLRERLAPGQGTQAPADWQASLSHLGHHLRSSFEAFPKRPRFLQEDQALSAELRKRYQAGSGKRLVGIAWHSAAQMAEAEKSIPLAQWHEILATPDVRFVSLQYGSHKAEIAGAANAAKADLISDPKIDGRTDMDRFSAQVGAMDLVISVSNTTVHVAAALGKPVWTLVPASVGRIWYWFLDRTDSPWYPSMRLFRQPRSLDWTAPLAEVAQSLRRWR